MKHTGTIQIDCGEITCDECQHYKQNFKDEWCTVFYTPYDGYRCQQCLDTFKEIKSQDIISDKINKLAPSYEVKDHNRNNFKDNLDNPTTK